MKTPVWYKKAAAVLLAACVALGLTACGSEKEGSGAASAYEEYVTGIMDANYLGQYETYMELTGSSQEDAKKLYDANIQDFALEMEDALSIDQDSVSVALTERMMEVAKNIYSQTKYEAVDVIREEDTYIVTLEIQPIAFFETVEDAFGAAVDDFNERAKNGEFDELSDTQYEEAYGEAVVEALEQNVSTVSYKAATAFDVVLDYDSENNIYAISDEQMETLDSQVVSMAR